MPQLDGLCLDGLPGRASDRGPQHGSNRVAAEALLSDRNEKAQWLSKRMEIPRYDL